ncbi:LacI family transcriptional regulator [Claveliimonas bilis]|nr:LacI family transcriptional regulator [Claveliimonas bilis]
MGNVTIVDIANACGVSIKSVSRVLNHSPNVSDQMREKVMNTIKEQGYQVNMLARGLKGSRTNIIVVFAERHHEEHLSIWHTIMLKYLFRYAKKRSMKIVLSPSSGERFEEDETDGFYLIASGIADGAILLENILQDARVDYFEKHKIPYIVFGEPENPNVPFVSLDNFDVGYKGGNYLATKQYQKIAMFVGEQKFLSTQHRIKGFEAAMEETGTEYQVFTGIDTVEKAYTKAKEILESYRPRAFFVSGDERALGVYRAIYERKLSIPQDVAVLGIDNITLGNYYYPPISTVEQDFEALAKCCIDYAIRKIEEPDKEERRGYIFACSVKERQST